MKMKFERCFWCGKRAKTVKEFINFITYEFEHEDRSYHTVHFCPVCNKKWAVIRKGILFMYEQHKKGMIDEIRERRFCL